MTGTDRNGREAAAGRGELRDGTAAVVWPRRAGAWLGAIAVGLALTTMVVVILAAFWETRLALSAVRLAAAETAAEAIADDLDHAIALGIPLDRLPGLDTYLDQRMTRLSELRFMAILDSRGVAFHRAGIGRRLEDVLAGVGGGFDPERQAVREVDGYLIVSLPLRGGAGWVLVASQPAQISQNLMDDLLSTVPFWLGCLVLVGWWAWIMAERGLAEPARVLGRIMRRAVGGGGGGRFDTLIVRRTRDAVGDCQWAVNAIAAGLHARERNFLQQAEEVRAAVFEPAVAAKVVELRDAVVGSSNGIGGPPPRRVHGTRRHDADPFAGMVVPAAGLGVVGAFAMASRLEGAPAMGGMALAGLLVLLAGLCAGLSVGRRCVSPRRTALGTVALGAASLIATAALLGTLPKTEAEAATLPLAGGLVAIMGGVIGAAVALATRCRERWAADAGVSGGGDTGTVGAWGTAALVGVASLGVGYGLINSPLGVFVAGICLCVPAAISALVGGFRMEPAEEPTDGVGRGGEGRAGEGRG